MSYGFLHWHNSPGFNPVSFCFGISCGSCSLLVPAVGHAFVPWFRHGTATLTWILSSELLLWNLPCTRILSSLGFSTRSFYQHSPGYYPVSSSQAPAIAHTFVPWVFDAVLLPSGPQCFLHYSAQQYAYFFDGNNPLVCKPLFQHNYGPLIQSDHPLSALPQQVQPGEVFVGDH